MKKYLIALFLIIAIATATWAIPPIPENSTFNGNKTIQATYSSIHTFTNANWDEDAATWTMAASGPLVHVAGNTTAVTATLTEAVDATTPATYRIRIAGTGGGGTATYTFGGVTGTTIAASGAIAIEDYITAITTDVMVITPASACTVSITSITIEKLTATTGDLVVDGNLTVRSPLLAPLYFPDGDTTFPSISFLNSPGMGFYRAGTNVIGIKLGSNTYYKWAFSGIWFKGNNSAGGGVAAYGADATTPSLSPNASNDPDTGIGTAGVDQLSLISGGVECMRLSEATTCTNTINGLIINPPQAVTCTAGGGVSALTITPTSSYVEITNSDADGCNITMSETGMVAGNVVTLCVVSNAGSTVNFADTPGVTELAGAFTANIDDCIVLRYGNPGTWREQSARSAN